MEEQVKAVFENIVMPERCARRIAASLVQRQAEEGGIHMRKMTGREKTGKLWLPLGAALCLLLGVGVLLLQRAPLETAPPAAEPTQAATEPLSREELEEKRLKRLLALREELGIDPLLMQAKEEFETKMSYTEGNIHYIFIHRGQNVFVEYDTELHTPFTEYTQGRVYFLANGERLDITEEFSEDTPFTYIFTDRKFMEHYIAIGGTADNPGWLEMVYASWEEKPMSFVTGEGHNTWNNKADARYGWETEAHEIFAEYGVDWPS